MLSDLKLPSRFSLSGEILRRVYQTTVDAAKVRLRNVQSPSTLLLDGWTCISRQQHETVMLVPADGRGESLGTLDLGDDPHTAANLFAALVAFVPNAGYEWGGIGAICTDSPSVNVCLRAAICKEYPHILDIRCCLHELNGMVRDACKPNTVKAVIRNARVIVNAVRRSNMLGERLRKWERQQQVRVNGLSLFIETRWFSVVPFLENLVAHQSPLLLLSMAQGTKLNRNLIRVTSQPTLYKNAKAIGTLLRPLHNALADLEKLCSTLGDVLQQILLVAVTVEDMAIPVNCESLRTVLLDSIHKRGARFLETPKQTLRISPHVLGFFLLPRWREVASSGKFDVVAIGRALLRLVCSWMEPEPRVDDLKDLVPQMICQGWHAEVQLYATRSPPYAGNGGKDPCAYFSAIAELAAGNHPRLAFCRIAVALHSIASNSAELERCFSALKYLKPALKNRKTQERLHMEGRIMRTLQHTEPVKREARAPSRKRKAVQQAGEPFQAEADPCDAEAQPTEADSNEGACERQAVHADKDSEDDEVSEQVAEDEALAPLLPGDMHLRAASDDEDDEDEDDDENILNNGGVPMEDLESPESTTRSSARRELHLAFDLERFRQRLRAVDSAGVVEEPGPASTKRWTFDSDEDV
jgi:hypothetical protein